MQAYIGEFVGTMMLVLLGDGVVANVVLAKTKGNGSGWAVITFGWAVAVMVPALMVGAMSGAHFNPALTLALGFLGATPAAVIPGYIVSQVAGAFCGAVLVYIMYKDHFDATDNPALKLAVFSTGPAIRNLPNNFISEVIGTFVLVFAILGIGHAIYGTVAALQLFGVAAIILTCGMSLGGTTGYAINPARDLGPRIAHFLLPIKDKGSSDWGYSWVPVFGPICGALIAAVAYKAIY